MMGIRFGKSSGSVLPVYSENIKVENGNLETPSLVR